MNICARVYYRQTFGSNTKRATDSFACFFFTRIYSELNHNKHKKCGQICFFLVGTYNNEQVW